MGVVLRVPMGNQQATGATVAELEELYTRELGRFRRLARALLGDAELARDVVQEAFASALRERSSFRSEGVLEAWLWRLVVNRALSELRRRKRRPAEQLAADYAAFSNGYSEELAPLRVAVALLPERQRAAVFLHYYADLDYARIAEVLHVQPGTVAASLTAARTSLRRTLEAEDQR
jgi:RNA polymerase sigma factor (sigma-70 family)